MNGRSPIAWHCIHQKYVKVAFSFFRMFILTCPLITAASSHPLFEISIHSNLIEVLADDTAQVKILMKLFDNAVGNNLVSAERHAREALGLSEKLNYRKGLISAYVALADIRRIKGNFEEAEDLIHRAISLSEGGKDEINLAKSYLTMFRLCYARGDYKKAEEFNEKSLAIGDKNSNTEILAEVYGNMGMILGGRGQHIEAVEFLLKSMEMHKSLQNKLLASQTLMRIGRTFELAGSYEKAMEYLFQALEENKRLNHLSNAGWCLLNIGVTYSRIHQDDYLKKLDYFKQALAMAEESGDFRLTLACLDNIGGTYSVRKDFENANPYLMRAYRLSKQAGHNSRTVYITGNLAENYLYAGKLDSAVLFGEENLKVAIWENNTFEKKQAYSVLSEVHAARKEYGKAYDMLLHHVNLSDSLFNVQKSQQIEDLREKYEADKKEQEITTLTKQKAAAEFRRNSFAVLAILFLVVGFLVFSILRLRVKKNHLLLEKEKELDRMKSRFFANISHEFRTPLTLILGPLDDVISRSEDPAILRYLKPMRKNASRLLELVNQLLELSRIESGKLKPELTRSNILTIVKGVVMSFDSLAEMKEIRLDVTADEGPIEMYTDRDKIEKILMNLLSNAFKFTPEKGNISVDVRRTSRDQIEGPECLHVSVTDSGTGIPHEEIAHIFDRFYQADNNQLHQQDGSGIGLALTKELVELHRGIIWAVSDTNQGTEIHFQIPLNLHEILKKCIVANPPVVFDGGITVNHERVLQERAFESAEIESENSRQIVLLIEDHLDVRNYIRDILENTYTVIEATDGEEGVATALERIPDLILCDVMMPKMNGNEVCRLLKGEERTSHIPIILLTAKADVESRIEGLETRADDYLTKPFLPKELKLRIKNLVESRQQIREKYLRTMTLKPSEIAVNSVDEQFLKKMMDILERHMADEKFGVEALGIEIGMSRSQLHRKLKALIGQGPNQFIRSFRLNRAHDLLKVNAATAAEIAYTVGFGSPSYFTKCFHEQFGYTPSEIGDR